MANTSFPKPPPVKTKRKSPAKHFIIGSAALIFSVAALIWTAIAWQRLDTTNTDLNKNKAQIEKSLSTFQQSLQKMQTTLAAHQKNIDQLMNQTGNDRAEQAMGEAAYLIRLAHLQLSVDSNITLTIKLLKMAAQRLANVTTPMATSLKLAITNDVTALSSTSPINVTHLLTRLDQLNQEITQLPTYPQQLPPTKTPPRTPPRKNWWDNVKHNLSGLKSLFIIRHVDRPITPLLGPQQTIFLKENVQLKISQAQWAILHHNAPLYQQSLNTAAKWLADHYQNQPAAETLIKRLQALALININPQGLTTLTSFNALQPSPPNTTTLPTNTKTGKTAP